MKKDFEVVPAIEAFFEGNAVYFSKNNPLVEADTRGMQITDVIFNSSWKEIFTAQQNGKGYVIDRGKVYQIFTYDEVLEAAEQITDILDKFLNAEATAETYKDYVKFAKRFLEAAGEIEDDVKKREIEAAENEKNLREYSAG